MKSTIINRLLLLANKAVNLIHSIPIRMSANNDNCSVAEPVVMEGICLQVTRPSKYNVLLFNDDVTPPEFVLLILIEIFNKTQDEAIGIIMTAEENDVAVVGSYSKDIAYSYVNKAKAIIAQTPFPLRIEAKQNEN